VPKGEFAALLGLTRITIRLASPWAHATTRSPLDCRRREVRRRADIPSLALPLVVMRRTFLGRVLRGLARPRLWRAAREAELVIYLFFSGSSLLRFRMLSISCQGWRGTRGI